MLLGGLQKNSLIDYPGKVSCVLFLSGCNFDCPYCHNPGLAKSCPGGVSRPDHRTVYDFLESRKGFLDGVVISGGEPTLQKDLFSLCQRLKQMEYPVKLDTNGSRPQTIKKLLDEGLVDYVAMDIKTDPFHYSSLTKGDCSPEDLLASIRIIMESSSSYEFRTTCVRPIVDEEIVRNISQVISGAMLYALQRFHNKQVLHPAFFHENETGFDEDGLLHLKSIADPWVRRCVVSS